MAAIKADADVIAAGFAAHEGAKSAPQSISIGFGEVLADLAADVVFAQDGGGESIRVFSEVWGGV